MATRKAPRPVRTAEKRAAFLTAIAKGDSVLEASRKAGIARSGAYAWRTDDAAFAAEWDAAANRPLRGRHGCG
jgi:hypothetical protein